MWGWTLLLVLWPLLSRLGRDIEFLDKLGEAYWVFLAFGGPGIAFPLPLIPLFKRKAPLFILYLFLSAFIYMLAYYIAAAGSDKWWSVMLGGSIGALGMGLLHYFTLIRTGRFRSVGIAFVLGTVSFVPSVTFEMNLLLFVCVPLWVASVGTYLIAVTPLEGKNEEPINEI